MTTVSPTYAREIKTAEFGANLDGVLRRTTCFGLLNGIDTEEWNPATDPQLAAHYDADQPRSQAGGRGPTCCGCATGPSCPDVPLFGVVSRMTAQKGLDLVSGLVSELHGLPARLVVLGTGRPSCKTRFRWRRATTPGTCAPTSRSTRRCPTRSSPAATPCWCPSRFEPCGLTQMYAMRCGTVPVVHATGGLADTVHDPGDVALARGRGHRLRVRASDGGWPALGDGPGRSKMYRKNPEGWRAIQQAGMRRDWSWTRSAADYLGLYRSLH